MGVDRLWTILSSSFTSKRKGKILSYSPLWAEYLNWMEGLKVSEMPAISKKILEETRSDRAIMRAMQEDDLAAIFKEGSGVKIFDKDTRKLLEHAIKALEAQSSVKNLTVNIKERLNELSSGRLYNSKKAELLKEILSYLSKVKDKYLKLMKESQCPSILKKLKP